MSKTVTGNGNVNFSLDTNRDLDLPIAFRKGIRTHNILSQILCPYRDCHKKPCLYHSFSSNGTPKIVQEALNSKPWKDAINEELQALEKNKTQEVMDLPKGKKTVGCRWIYTIKYKVDGTIERSKARLVAKGYTQTMV